MCCCFHRKSNGVGLEPMSNIQMVGPASFFKKAILHLRWNDCCIHICFYGLDRHGRKAPMFRLASLLVLLAVSGAVLAVFQILRPGVYHCWVSLCVVFSKWQATPNFSAVGNQRKGKRWKETYHRKKQICWACCLCSPSRSSPSAVLLWRLGKWHFSRQEDSHVAWGLPCV